MPVRLIDDFDEFASLQPVWNELAGSASFRRWEWMHSWFATYRSESSLNILEVADRAGVVIGFAPWYSRENLRYGRCLRFLGDGKACGDDVSLLAAPGRGDDVIDGVVGWLTDEENRDAWDWIRLEGSSTNDRLVRRLCEQLDAWGASVLVRDDLARWVVPLPATWDEFVSAFSRNGRHHARSARRKVETPENGYILRTPSSEAQCLELFDVLVDLHQRRWQGFADGGCFSAPGFEEFLRAAMLGWYAEGSLYLAILEFHGRPIVGGLGVVHGDAFSMYMFGRDPDPELKDVGKLLNFQTIREAIERGYKKLDFLRGDEQYKGRLRAYAVPQSLVQIANRGALNRVRYYATAGREVAKRALRRKPKFVADTE